jgi:lysozyme
LIPPIASRTLWLKAVLTASLILILAASQPSGPVAQAGESYLMGVDVSHWNGKVGWRKARAAGVKFVIAKATDGRQFVDSQYARNKAKADELGLRFTAYHFARPSGGVNDPLLEADHFVRTAGLRGRHLVPVLDLEVTGGLGETRLIRWVRAWLERVESRLGVKPMIYTSPSFWRERMGNTRWFANHGYDLWIAHWHTSEPRVPAGNWGGAGWSFWQKTDCGRLPGFDGCVDVDLHRGTDIGRLTIRNRRG